MWSVDEYTFDMQKLPTKTKVKDAYDRSSHFASVIKMGF